jgi:NAD kinase
MIAGQVGAPLLKGDQVICSRSHHSVYLILPPRMAFFDVLRTKLQWGTTLVSRGPAVEEAAVLQPE